MPVVVVGAGVTGLTLARELARRGEAVTVVEREAGVGGLARTFRYGRHFFDVGPHRFHTDAPEVEGLLRATLGAELLEIRRASAVRAFGGLHAWPLRPRVLAALPPSLLARCALDLLRRERLPGDSFEAEVVNRYGRTLYESFFRGYTERFLGVAPDRVHRDWARAGMDRAVIDSRYRADGLWALARSTLRRRGAETRFLYPRGGVGRLADRLAEDVVAAGGKVLLGAPVTAIHLAGGRIAALTRGAERLPADRVVWTGPLTEAARLLGVEAPGLEFLSTVLYNVELLGPPLVSQQWVYFGGDESFVRVSAPAAFSPAAAPPGRGALCVEVTCRRGDEAWRGAEARAAAVIADLVRAGAIASAAQVDAVHVERVPETYPVYALGYREDLRRALRALASVDNLLLAGRGGRFWYNNMDHGIEQALRIAPQLAGRRSVAEVDVGEREFWART